MNHPSCPTCQDRFFIREAPGTRRCPDCFDQVIDKTSIVPLIKGGDPRLPEGFRSADPWPLTDREVKGSPASYDEFRYMVWRTLQYHFMQGHRLDYEYIDALYLTEIHFKRLEHPRFKSIYSFTDPALVVIVAGLNDWSNSGFTPTIIRSVRETRKMHGKPTWLFTTGGPSTVTVPRFPPNREIREGSRPELVAYRKKPHQI